MTFLHECLDIDQIDTEVKNKNKTQKISRVKAVFFFSLTNKSIFPYNSTTYLTIVMENLKYEIPLKI